MLDCTKLKWTSKLRCGGGSLSSGGAKLRLKQGPVGTGKGTGIYAPGFIASSSETVVYELPGPSRTVKFKRKFTIEFGGFVR